MNIYINEKCKPKKDIRLIFHVKDIKQTTTVTKSPQYRRFPLIGVIDMALTMNTIQQCVLEISPTDAKGHPAKVDGVPEWLTDNSNIVTLIPAADGLSCGIAAVGVPGTCKVQVTADADLGAGVSNLVGTLDVEIVSAPATNIEIKPGPITDQA